MAAAPERPNILLIMDDQHRFDYLGCAGTPSVHTPNLDFLAGRGVRFTQCISNSPVCVPARIALATGQQPFRLGSLDNGSFLPRSARTYYQRLRDYGYRVGCVGKLDLAKPDPYNGRFGDRPCAFGWGFTHPEECEGKMHAATSPVPIGPYTHYLQEQGLLAAFYEDYRRRRARGWIRDAAQDSVLPAQAYEDAYIGRRAAEWIRWVPDDFPWHFMVSFVGPHDPFDPPREYADRCRHAQMPEAIPSTPAGKPAWYAARQLGLTPDQVAVTRRQYAASIALIDDQIGEILNALRDRGWFETTHIIFTSDHGEMLGDHGLYTKSVPYESALRVPLIVSSPGRPAGRVCDALVELADLNPTICDLAGLPRQEDIDGLSLLPLLAQPTGGHRTETLSVMRHFRCLRTATHKLIYDQAGGVELYDLAADPGEAANIAPAQPAMVSDLSARLGARLVEGKWRR